MTWSFLQHGLRFTGPFFLGTDPYQKNAVLDGCPKLWKMWRGREGPMLIHLPGFGGLVTGEVLETMSSSKTGKVVRPSRAPRVPQPAPPSAPPLQGGRRTYARAVVKTVAPWNPSLDKDFMRQKARFAAYAESFAVLDSHMAMIEEALNDQTSKLARRVAAIVEKLEDSSNLETKVALRPWSDMPDHMKREFPESNVDWTEHICYALSSTANTAVNAAMQSQRQGAGLTVEQGRRLTSLEEVESYYRIQHFRRQRKDLMREMTERRAKITESFKRDLNALEAEYKSAFAVINLEVPGLNDAFLGSATHSQARAEEAEEDLDPLAAGSGAHPDSGEESEAEG